jgi:hypothetical protein
MFMRRSAVHNSNGFHLDQVPVGFLHLSLPSFLLFCSRATYRQQAYLTTHFYP